MLIEPAGVDRGESLGAIRKEYSKRRALLVEALNEAKKAIAEIRQKHRKRATLRIAYIDGRVKELSSIIRKACDRSLAAGKVWDELGDILGLRIVVNNLCDVEPLVGELATHPAFEVAGRDKKDELGGYRAKHLQARFTFEHEKETQSVACEIQVRTLLQDAWAVLTHHDVYRNQASLPGLAQDIPQHLSNSLSTLDDLADKFRVEIEKEVEPPNDLSDDAPLDKQGIAFLYYEVVGEKPQEYEVDILEKRASELGIETVGQAREGLKDEILQRLRQVHDLRFPDLPLGSDALEYGMLCAATGPAAFVEYDRQVEAEWEEIEAFGRSEIMSELPDTYEEFLDELGQGSVSTAALRELGGVQPCDVCGTEVLVPYAASEGIQEHYGVEDREDELLNLLQSGIVGPEIESVHVSGLCQWCGHMASKDD